MGLLGAKANKISLDSEGFTFKEEFFEYARVISLYYYYEVTTHQLAFGGDLGKDHFSRIEILLDGREKPVQIRSDIALTYLGMDSTESSAKQVQQLYSDLREKTVGHRLGRYLEMLDRYGYFIYDQKKFYPDGRVIDPKMGELNLKTDGPIYREPFRIYYEREKTPLQKLAHLWTDQEYNISTFYDPDVFFYLLKQLYGLGWE